MPPMPRWVTHRELDYEAEEFHDPIDSELAEDIPDADATIEDDKTEASQSFWQWCTGKVVGAAKRWNREPEEELDLNPIGTGGQAAIPGRDGLKLVRGVLVDSGAGATCGNGEELFPEFDLQEFPPGTPGTTLVGPFGERSQSRGTRAVKLRLGGPQGTRAKINFQDAGTRRAILSVGESEAAGNLLVFDSHESVILPRGAPEIPKIRDLVAKATKKMTMIKERNTYQLPAWIEPPDESAHESSTFTAREP